VSIAAALVLAAGTGSRFGGQKLLASLDGTPIIQFSLDLAHAARLGPVAVVLGHDAPAFERAIGWRDEIRIVNSRPEAGISTSVRLGLESLARTDASRALVLLGDQPRLSLAQVQVVLGAAVDESRPIVVPRYNGVPGNPVLLERAAWALAERLQGDSGMAQLFAANPDLLRYVDVPGANPDIDTPADLAALESAP
jgi:molybdenum cofactor cytidylyltransferase